MEVDPGVQSKVGQKRPIIMRSGAPLPPIHLQTQSLRISVIHALATETGSDRLSFTRRAADNGSGPRFDLITGIE